MRSFKPPAALPSKSSSTLNKTWTGQPFKQSLAEKRLDNSLPLSIQNALLLRSLFWIAWCCYCVYIQKNWHNSWLIKLSGFSLAQTSNLSSPLIWSGTFHRYPYCQWSWGATGLVHLPQGWRSPHWVPGWLSEPPLHHPGPKEQKR